MNALVLIVSVSINTIMFLCHSSYLLVVEEKNEGKKRNKRVSQLFFQARQKNFKENSLYAAFEL